MKNKEQKSFLEKRIHEQAVEEYDRKLSRAYEDLKDSILGDLVIDNYPKDKFFDKPALKGIDWVLEDVLRANASEYDQFKEAKIEEIEKKKTDQILDEIGGITDLLRNRDDIPF